MAKTITEERDEFKVRAEAAEAKVAAFDQTKVAAVDAAVSAAVTPLNAQIATLTTERDAAKAEVVSEKAAHKITTDSLAAKTTELATAQTEISTLKANSKTTSEKAREIAGSQMAKTPVEGSTAQAQGGTLTEQYEALLKTDAKAAAEFQTENWNALFAESRKK